MGLTATRTVELHALEYHILRIKIGHTSAWTRNTERSYVHLGLRAIRSMLDYHITAWGEFDNFHDVLRVIKYLLDVYC